MRRRSATRRAVLTGGLLFGMVTTGGLLIRAQTPTAGAQTGGPGSPAAGATVYAANCSFCHGDNLAGDSGNPTLKGRPSVPDYPNAYVLYDYIKRSMPYGRPGSLSEDDVLSVTAYLLNQNDLLPADGVLKMDELRTFRLPGADPQSPPLSNAPAEPQRVTPGSTQSPE